MAHIFHRVGIQSEPYKVFDSLSSIEGISNWWTSDTSGEATMGSLVVTRFRNLDGSEMGTIKFEVIDLVSNQKVQWKFLEGPTEWIGTEVVFELLQEGIYTIVLFRHMNWAEEVEFMAHCSLKWAVFLLSLKQYIEEGKGSPSPHDIKIDNWN